MSTGKVAIVIPALNEEAVSKQRIICCVRHFSLADGVEQIKSIRESMLAITVGASRRFR